jgi:ADP-ribose pyrophosphatase YjhB (NUDIX family)
LEEKIANEEESLVDTAKREVKEETDLDFQPKEHFYFAETFVKDIHNIGHAFLGEWQGNVKINPAEHSEYGWFTYEEALKLPLAFNTKEIIDLLHSRRLI